MQFFINDGLPPYLCEQCIIQLGQFYEFKQKCEETHRKLRVLRDEDEFQKTTSEFTIDQLLLKTESILDSDSEFEVKTELEELDFLFEDCKPDFISITDEPQQQPYTSGTTTELPNKSHRKSDQLLRKQRKNVKHKKKRTPRVDLFCDICPFKVKHMCYIERHMQEAHNMPENLRPCPQCGKLFNRRKLRPHINQHGKQYDCELCGFTFLWAANLRRHINAVHQQLRPFVCEICNDSFSAKHSMNQHIATVHHNQSNYVCETCGMRFKFKPQLNVHEVCHFPDRKQPINTPKKKKNPERKYICTYCGKISNSCSIHTLHERVHTGQKPYECKLCLKRFRSQGSFKAHSYTHTGEKPYVCNICDMKFRQSSHLSTHRKIHTQEKPFVCEDCGKQFALKCNYAAHKRLHTGEKPYQCEQCEQRFIDTKVLNKHRLKCQGGAGDLAGALKV